MESFSELLLAIYRASRELDPADFQESVLTMVKSVLAFDSCTWSTSIITPEQGLVYLSAHLYEEMPGRLQDYDEARLQDTAAFVAVSHPKVTMNFHAPTLYSERGKEAIRAYCSHYRHQNILATAKPDPATGVNHGLAFYRGDADDQFSEAERRLCKCLVPHLMEALGFCYGNCLERLKTLSEERHHFVALAGRRGVIQHAEPSFSALLRSEWPGWDGLCLPRPLLEVPLANGRAVFTGLSVVVLLTRIKDLVFLQVRPKMPADNLTPRERVVAACVAEGLSYKEIARRLNIAPATARNHIQAIHERLGVHKS